MKVDNINNKQSELEKQLYYANLQLTTIYNNIDALIYIADMQGYEILYVNKHLKKQYGEDIIGKTCWKSLHNGMEGPCEFCTNNKLIDLKGEPTKPYIWEIYNKKLEGWYEIHDQVIPWTDGRFVRLEMAMDITKRKNAEILLKKSEEKWHKYINDAPYGIFIVSKSGNKIYDVNPEACKMINYTKKDLLSMSISDILAQESIVEGLDNFNKFTEDHSYGERFIRSVRQECLDWFIIFSEKQLRNILKPYMTPLQKPM